jgi:hypothetical protein
MAPRNWLLAENKWQFQLPLQTDKRIPSPRADAFTGHLQAMAIFAFLLTARGQLRAWVLIPP